MSERRGGRSLGIGLWPRIWITVLAVLGLVTAVVVGIELFLREGPTSILAGVLATAMLVGVVVVRRTTV